MQGGARETVGIVGTKLKGKESQERGHDGDTQALCKHGRDPRKGDTGSGHAGPKRRTGEKMTHRKHRQRVPHTLTTRGSPVRKAHQWNRPGIQSCNPRKHSRKKEALRLCTVTTHHVAGKNDLKPTTQGHT